MRRATDDADEEFWQGEEVVLDDEPVDVAVFKIEVVELEDEVAETVVEVWGLADDEDDKKEEDVSAVDVWLEDTDSLPVNAVEKEEDRVDVVAEAETVTLLFPIEVVKVELPVAGSNNVGVKTPTSPMMIAMTATNNPSFKDISSPRIDWMN